MTTINVNPEILHWARETAGLDLDSAAQKLQIGATRSQTSAERLLAYENGEAMPTRSLLLKMAKSYRRPLLAFYLAEPPARGDRGEDFRRMSEDMSPASEGLVDALVRDVKARQSIVRAVLEDEDEAERLAFVGSMTIDHGTEAVGESIRRTLQFDLVQFRAQHSAAEAFSYIREQAESAGIFVLLIGDLGSHHTALSVNTFRGCALADSIAPFVVINDQDAKAAWSFTLLHELAHIWLGQTGVSAAIVEAGIERFCNDVAASLLLSPEDFQHLVVPETASLEVLVEQLNVFATERNISRTMVAYQLFRRGVIGSEQWYALQAEFRRLWMESRTDQRLAARRREGGPNYFVIRRYRAGRALVSLVSRMTKSGALTSTKAAKVLGVKPRNVFDLMSAGR